MPRKLLILLAVLHLPLAAQQQTRFVEETASANSHQLKGGDVYHEVTVRRPSPAEGATALTQINPHLPSVLTDFENLMRGSRLSPHFKTLYDLKMKQIRAGNTLTAHNYYDCASILNIMHPSGQRLVWIQGDLDVVTDGTDPNRFPLLSDYDEARISDWFLPATGYSWGGASAQNPFIQYYPETIKKLDQYKAEFQREAAQDGGVAWRGLIEQCEFQARRMKIRNAENLSTMKSRRSLVALHDPFIVIPLTWFREQSSYALNHGDKAAVIYQNRVIPAIVGDAGPSYKVGEASLKIAKILNPKASGKVRAVDSLGVSYLIFPNTADKPRAAPDLARINSSVSALLSKIGGITPEAQLHTWQ